MLKENKLNHLCPMSYTKEQIENLFNQIKKTNTTLYNQLESCWLDTLVLKSHRNTIKNMKNLADTMKIISVEALAIIFFIMAAVPTFFIALAGCLILYLSNQFLQDSFRVTSLNLSNDDAHIKICLNILISFSLFFFPQLYLTMFLVQCLTAWSIHSNLFKQFEQKYQKQIDDKDVLNQSHYQVTKNDLNTFLTKSIDETNGPTSVAQEIPANSLFRQPDVQNPQNDPMSDDDLNQIMASIINSESIKLFI
ncbi:MAG: hypothetical protein P8L77_03175 [Gammaproteobacteria bacterium]|nr:hypothetical protein [Gammaproteobacteria bacterium]